MTKLFLTGATGYIGGDFLHTLSKARPDVEVSALVRDKSKEDGLKKAYPNLRIVIGDLDDSETVAREAAAADIVCHLAATGHLGSVKAIHEGLTSDSSRSKPAYWIQISGATLLAGQEIASKTFGEPTDTVHDDSTAGLESLKSLIKSSPSRTVDNFILSASTSSSGPNTALLVGPIFYGAGRGPGHQRSVQVPEMARVALQHGGAVKVGRGLNRWGYVHVHDMSELCLKLVDKAVAGDTGAPAWKEEGFYLPQAGEVAFGDIAAAIGEYAHGKGYVASADVESLEPAKADGMSGHAAILWGTNARSVGTRAMDVLGWRPAAQGLLERVPAAVEDERMG